MSAIVATSNATVTTSMVSVCPCGTVIDVREAFGVCVECGAQWWSNLSFSQPPQPRGGRHSYRRHYRREEDVEGPSDGPAARSRMLAMVERTVRPWQVAFSWLRQRLTNGHDPSRVDHGITMCETAVLQARAAMGGEYHREQELREALLAAFPKVLQRLAHTPRHTPTLKERLSADAQTAFRKNATTLGLGDSYQTYDTLAPSMRSLLAHRRGIAVIGDVLVLDASSVATDLPVEAWVGLGYVREASAAVNVRHGRKLTLIAVVRWRGRVACDVLRGRTFRDVVVAVAKEMSRQGEAR